LLLRDYRLRSRRRFTPAVFLSWGTSCIEPGFVIQQELGDGRVRRMLGYVLGAAIALAVLGGTVAVFWNDPNHKTDFDPVVP
jgi:hypothetical protein